MTCKYVSLVLLKVFSNFLSLHRSQIVLVAWQRILMLPVFFCLLLLFLFLRQFEMRILTSFLCQPLRMDMQLRVLRQNLLIVRRTDQIWMLFRLFFRRDEIGSDIWRPEVCGGRARPSKSLLELPRVEHLNELGGVALTRKHDLLLCLWVNEDLDTIVEKTLAPAHMGVE